MWEILIFLSQMEGGSSLVPTISFLLLPDMEAFQFMELAWYIRPLLCLETSLFFLNYSSAL